jgi:DNA-binding response OmpR family regulator/signal transduction histidine kinase
VDGTVLIVDDSLTVRMNLAEAFEVAGFRPLPCASAREAREALAREPIALIILDVLLPDADGVDLLKELRGSAAMRDLPVLMLSTEAEVKDRIRGLQTGADDYVGKPYDTGYVISRGGELVRRRSGYVPPERSTVLVIDDSSTFREQLQEALECRGYAVVTASTGEDGLRLAAERRPAAIIVDGVMSGIDGVTVIRKIRLDAALRGTPCLLLTASEDYGAELRALDAGADAFVRKEEDVDVILARLGATLRSAGTQRPEAASLVGPKRVLAVDDSMTYLQELAGALRWEGYDVVLAKSGEEALEMVAVQSVDCILLDLLMPGLDGKETCKRLKASPVTRDIPVVMLTALEDRAAMIEGLSTGADDYISKSSELDVLKARVQAQIRRKQFEDENRRIREDLLRSELHASEERAARQLAETRAALVEELERKNRELEALNKEVGEANAAAAVEIAERKRIESEVRRMNEELESRVAERTRKQHQQLSQLELLNRITRAVEERQDLLSILQVVIRSLERDLPIDFGCVCLYEPLAKKLTVAHVGAQSQTLGSEAPLTEKMHIQIDQNGLARCVRGELVCETDITACASPFPQRLARAGLRSLVIAPLAVGGNTFGMLVAARRVPNGFTSSDCEFLQQLSEHVALAAHQAQLYGNLQRAYEDLRQTQLAVMQQERLRALGQMASGVAHDINNALSPAALYAQSLLEREASLSVRAREQLEIIQRAIEDVGHTVGRLREFYRPRDSQSAAGPVQFQQLLAQVVSLTRVRWLDMPQERGIVIRVETSADADLPPVLGWESELRDALTNLVLNSVDAMPEGGTLQLRAAPVSEAGGTTHVQVEVSDTGVGMDEDTRRKCLEPFFTTKGERGSGLGLAMVYGALQRHGGEIEIDSKPLQGTTVRLIFKVDQIAAGAGGTPAPPARPARRLRILVVDDDPLLLKSMREVLEADGHEVVVADGGQAGIDSFLAALQRGEPFAAVLSDLGMPYVDGRKVADAVKAVRPATPVLLVTGWGQRMNAEEDLPPHVDRVLSKPPKLSELRRALAELTGTIGPQISLTR